MKDIIIDPSKKIDLLSLPESEAISLIKESYGFLSKHVEVAIREGMAIISVKEEKEDKKNKAQRLFDIAITEAQKGNYKKAIKTFKEVLNYYPNHVDARRNMGMAYLESGDITKAKQHLHECLLIDPKDTWTYLLLGNISAKQDRDMNRAEYYYKLCLSMNPKDNFLLNNYAALLMETGDYEKAYELFNKALEVDSTYPNTYLGLAMLYQAKRDWKSSLTTLNNLFSHAQSNDLRSVPVFQEARSLYLSLCKQYAEESHDYFMKSVLERKDKLETGTGYPIKIIEDNSLQDIFAVAQMAWRHNSIEHTVRYRDILKAITPHLIAHEFEHIRLETEARKVNRNRHFMTTSETREIAIKSTANHINYLKNKGYSEGDITKMINQMIQGVIAQVYNCPLDMMVEYRVNDDFNEIYCSQFVSINKMINDFVRILGNRDLEKLTPKHIYHASVSLNCTYAIFADFIFKGKTDFASSYKPFSTIYQTGKQLFDNWHNRMKTFKPGDEYEMIDDFSRILNLNGWYKWQEDLADTGTAKKHIISNEYISERSSEIYKYCLEAIRRFENKSREEILIVASEIGFVGVQGIDYVTAGKTYTLKSVPGEKLTGLQLLCMMYVGFKAVEPSLNTELNFDKEYDLALEAYNKGFH